MEAKVLHSTIAIGDEGLDVVRAGARNDKTPPDR